MIALAAVALTAALCITEAPAAAPPDRPAAAARDSADYRRLFEGGNTMEQFLAAARARREQWHRNYESATVPDALVVSATASPGGWKLLVVAVDGCSDSVNTIPYVARLVEKLPGVEMRIVGSDAGRAVMESHRTPDGRGATPTVILLDAAFRERGCWIERPAELRDWILENRGKLKDNEIFERKMKWYDDDRGQSTMREVAAMMTAAAEGKGRC